MKEFWNERFAAEAYMYGEQPNEFFRNELSKLNPGRILLPGEGEGRNAVYASASAWKVDAIDFSEAAKTKALRLAALRGVTINYKVAELENFEPETAAYDAVGLVYVHLMPETRKQLHSKLRNALKPGGTMIMEAFSSKQLQKQSGGPKNAMMLYDVDALMQDFSSFSIKQLTEDTIDLSEGQHHLGEAVVIRLIAIKP